MSKQATEDEILKLVRLVDRNFKFNWADAFFRDGNALPFASFIFIMIVIVFYVLTAPLHEQIVATLGFLAFTVAFFSLMVRSGKIHIVKVNFRRIGVCVEKHEKSLLKALIIMKAKNQEIELEQIYNINESMFSKEKLLERLYE